MSNSRSGFERVVWFHSMSLKSVARTQGNSDTILPTKKLSDLEGYIINSKGFEHSYTINKHKAILNLQDVSISSCGNYIVLMINLSDTAGSTKVIRDNKSKARREFSLEKDQDQGFEYSSHILISRKHNSDFRYTVLVEKSPLLSSYYIELFINKIIFNVAKNNEELFTVSHEFGLIDSETENVKKIRYKPMINLESMPDENLMVAIKTGKFSSITLISREEKVFCGVDSNVEIIETQREVKLSTAFTSTTGSFFKGVKEHYRNDFDTVKVSFKSDGINASAAFNISDISTNGLESVVTKKVLIDGFVDTLKDAYETISSDIITKMLKLAP